MVKIDILLVLQQEEAVVEELLLLLEIQMPMEELVQQLQFQQHLQLMQGVVDLVLLDQLA